MVSRIHLVALVIISLLGCCMELDISIPSFPQLKLFFNASEAQVQNTLSLNFLAFCLSGLFYGPLSEAWGRRGLMLFGATCFLVGALGCVFSFSIYQLMFWRFIQGLGASSTVVLGFVMISDKYQGEKAAGYIGQINAYVTIFMSIAPILGSLLASYFSWRANFTVIAAIAFVAWGLLMMALPETKVGKTPLNIKNILRDYIFLIKHPPFLLHASMPNLLVSAYLTFVGSAAFYYIDTCHLSYFQYAIHQGLIVFSFSAMSFYAHKVITRIGEEQALRLGMYCAGLSMIEMLLVAWCFPLTPVLITAGMGIFAIGCAFPMSVTFAQSMEILPDLKGACSSFIMSSRLFLSSAAVALTGLFFDGTMRPVVMINAFLISIAILCYVGMQRKLSKVLSH